MHADAVRISDSSVTNHAVEGKMKSWLRQTRDRDGGRRRRFLVSERRRDSGGSSLLDQMPIDNSESDVSADAGP